MQDTTLLGGTPPSKNYRQVGYHRKLKEKKFLKSYGRDLNLEHSDISGTRCQLSYPFRLPTSKINDYIYCQQLLTSLTDALNFVEEILFPCSCDTDSDNLTTGKTLSVPQMTSR